MALGGWNPPGHEAPSNRWQYDVGKGWSPPGHGTAKAGTQFTFHDSFDPSTSEPKGFHVLASPPGTSAPIKLINYTPDTKEVHQPGVLAPVDKLNYSIVPPSMMAPSPSAGRVSQPAPTGEVGVGQDNMHTSDWNRSMMTQAPALATSMPTSPLSAPVSSTPSAMLPPGALTPRGPGARPPFMPTSSTSTDWKGVGVGSDASGNEPGDEGYDPSTEDDPNLADPYADTSGDTSGQMQASPDVGGPMQGPMPQPGQAAYTGQTFPDGQHMQDWGNGKLVASWTLKPHGDPSIPADWVKDPAPTAKIGPITFEAPQTNPDGSVTQKGSNGRVLPVHAAPAVKDKWKTVTNPDGSVWQIDETTNQIHQIRAATKPSTTVTWGAEQTREDGTRYQISSTGQIRNLGAAPKPTSATQHWTTTETRQDGSLLQTNDSTGAVRVIAAPKQPTQYHVVGRSIVRTDPNDPGGKGQVVYNAPQDMSLQTDSSGNILGINPQTGETKLLYQDAAGQDKADLANARSRQDLIPHASVQGGNVVIPYGAEATLQDYNPLTRETGSRHYGQMIIPPEATRSPRQNSFTPPADTAPPPADKSVVPPQDVVSPSDSSIPAVSTPAGIAGTQNDPVIQADYVQQPPTDFAQSDINEGTRRRVIDEVAPAEDVGSGAASKRLGSNLQKDLSLDIPSYRHRKKSKKQNFLGRGLDDFKPFVGAGALGDASDPATAYEAGQGMIGDEVSNEFRMKRYDLTPPESYGPQLRHAESPLVGDEDPELNMRMQYPMGGQSIANRREAGPARGWTPPNPTDRISPQDLPQILGREANPDAVEADFGRIGAQSSRNSSLVTDTGGRTDIGGDWTPVNPAHVINQGEIQAPKPRIMLPMPGGPGQTDIGADWSPGAQGGVTASNIPGRGWQPGNDPGGFDPNDFSTSAPGGPRGGRPFPQHNTRELWPQNYGTPEEMGRGFVPENAQGVEGGTPYPSTHLSEFPGEKPFSIDATDLQEPYEPGTRIHPTSENMRRGVIDQSVSMFDEKNPDALQKMMEWRDKTGALGTGAESGFGPPTPEQGAVSPKPPQGGPPGGMPGMPPTPGPQPPTPPIPPTLDGPGGMGGKLSPKVMALILAILQEAKGGSTDMPGQPPSPHAGGMPGQMPPGMGAAGAPPMPGGGPPGMPGAGAAAPPINPVDAMGMGHKFGQPLDSGEPLHKGTDIQAVKGTPVWAPVDGIVRIENNPQGLGLQVKIVGADGREHGLGHLASVAVHDGQHIRKGENVGKVGDSGNTTGAHLDYRQQNMQDGNFENPEPGLGGMAQMPPVPGTEMMGSGAGWQPSQQIDQLPPNAGMGSGGEGGMGAGGMRLANGKWSDAIADTPENKAKYGEGSGYTGGYGYQGPTSNPTPHTDPNTGGSPSGGGGGKGDTIAMSPAEQARIQLDTQIAQWTHDRDTANNQQAIKAENDRHSETVTQLQQQAQQEADWKSVQDALQAETVRHNQVQEQLTQKQQALDLQLEQMKEAQQMKLQGITSRMDILNSAMKNPWLTKLTGLTPKGGVAGQEGVGGGNIQALIDQILGGSNAPLGASATSGVPGQKSQTPDWQTWQSWSPFQKAAWRTNTEAAGPGAFENAQAQAQQGWGNANPNVTQLAGATADAAGTAGMEMTGEMFGSTPQDFWTQQNKQWSAAQAPSVKQNVLAGMNSPFTVGG